MNRDNHPIQLVAVALIVIGAVTTAAEDLYHVTTIGGLPGGSEQTINHDINDRTQIVGESESAVGLQPFLWDAVGGMINLGGIGGTNSDGAALGINNMGQVVGHSRIAGGYGEAFFWEPGSVMIGLGDLPGGSYFSWAYAINDLSEVTGRSSAALGSEAFLWTRNTGMVGIGELPGGQYTSTALGINNQTQIVGWSVSDRGFESFIWEPELGMRGICCDTPGVWFDDAWAINNRGQVTGAGWNLTTGVSEPVVWEAATGARMLGVIPGPNVVGRAYDINDRGEVVGSFLYEPSAWVNSGPPTTAFVWDEQRGLRSLGHLLDASGRPPHHWIAHAYAINNAGQIAASYGRLLTAFTLGDMNCDRTVDGEDIGPFALALLDYAAYEQTFAGCHGDWAGDLNQDGAFDVLDVEPFVACVVAGGDCRRPRIDLFPPEPEPVGFTFLSYPSGTDIIVMHGAAVQDMHSPPVEYMFELVIAYGPGGTSSPWQLEYDYIDDGLQANTLYTYRFYARDSADPPNVTRPSNIRATATRIETPQGIQAGAVTQTSVALTAVGTFTNLMQGQSGLYFESPTPGGNGGLRQWIRTATATAVGLQPGTEYTFQVKARNYFGVETVFGPPLTVTTLP